MAFFITSALISDMGTDAGNNRRSQGKGADARLNSNFWATGLNPPELHPFNRILEKEAIDAILTSPEIPSGSYQLKQQLQLIQRRER